MNPPKLQQSSMDFTQEEEDKENLIMNIHGGYGFPPVKVVEYMLPSMSDELLCKFPDNSAFDFDYTQSSIWSPLVPHPSNPSSPAPDLQKTLSFDDAGEPSGAGEATGTVAVMKKLTENLKEKIADSCVFSCFQIHGKIGKKKKKMIVKRRRSKLGFEKLGPISSDSGVAIADRGCSSPNRREGWKKVLKAASKQFKKTMKKKEGHLKLSNGVSDFYH